MSTHIETNTAQSIVEYDPNTPVTAHRGFLAAMYEDHLRQADTVLNVAAGHTDLGTDLQQRGIEAHVTSLDPIYDREPGKDRVAGYAQSMPFEDGSFDMTVSQFGMQHIPQADLGNAIREMVRVTKTADNPADLEKGIIFINPVFRAGKLQRALQTAGFNGSGAAVMAHDAGHFPQSERHLVKSSLVIQKTEALTPERVDALVAAITETNALRPMYRSLGELASRAFGGHSNM